MARLRGLALAAAGILVLVVVLSTLGGSARVHVARPHALSALAKTGFAESGGAGPLAHWPLPLIREAQRTQTCRPTSGPSDYVNPLVDARIRPERIDQGVDYAGSGRLVAIGAGTVTYVSTSDTGWPGAFIEYRLLNGIDANCYVYYAEGVNPAAGLRVGQTVTAGQPIASIIQYWSTGIEIGWGAGVSTVTYAAETHQWSYESDQDSVPSASGKVFSSLIASLGGPPGKNEG